MLHRFKKINLPIKSKPLIFMVAFAIIGGGYLAYKSLAATTYYLSPNGNDANSCTQAAPCLSFDRAYQLASPGSKVQIASGSYGSQTILPKASMRNLSPGCTLADTTNCVIFEPVGTINVNGKIEVRGSSIYIKGTRSTSTPDANATFTINASGYADIEAESDSNYPDHVIMQGINANTFGAFNVNTATFKDMDVGPATTYWAGTYQNCCREGVGFENKIGWGGGVSYVPRDITIDSVRIHNQNGDSTRLQPGADVHFGGLFLVTVDGLTVKNSVFERNVVYQVQIQNFGGAPPAKRVVFDNNSFGCAVNWIDEGDTCDGQSSIQFDYDPGTEFTISNNVANNGPGEIFACYVGSCGGLTGVRSINNVSYAQSTTAPPLPGSSGGGTAPTLSLTANPTSITSGSSSTLSWSSTNTTSCNASGAWSGTKATSGTQSVSPTTTSTYNLSCTGSGGSANANATVTVTSGGGSGCAVSTSHVPDGPDGMGGCWPGPSTTGPNAPESSMSAYTGSCTITTANVTIDSKVINCSTLTVGSGASGLVVKNSYLKGGVVQSGSASFTIQDSFLDNAVSYPACSNGSCPAGKYACGDPNNQTTDCGVTGRNFTILRTEIINTNRAAYCESTCLIQDSYFHGTNLWPDKTNLAHASSVRNEQYLTLRHNALGCDYTGPFPNDELGCSADMSGYPDFTPIKNATIDSNLFLSNNIGAGFCVYGGGTAGKPYSNDPTNATYIVFQNNVFQRGANGKCGSYGPVTDFISGRTGNIWSNNKYDNGTTVNPG